MPRRQDGEERPGRYPSGSLRSSWPAARKELAIFDRSDTFSLLPQSTAVLGGRPVALWWAVQENSLFQRSLSLRKQGAGIQRIEHWIPDLRCAASGMTVLRPVIASLAEQGVAISGFEIATVAALPRNDNKGITTILEKPTTVPF